MRKKVPYGVCEYEEIITDNYYYVDKTAYIRTLEQWENPIFQRPKRFGKSLFCSMLSYYYDYTMADRFQELFGHTDIGKNPTGKQNTYSVLKFDFSTVKNSTDLKAIEASFNLSCRQSFLDFIASYPKIGISEKDLPADASDALYMVTQTARRAGLPPIFIIIDEYDNFTNTLLTTGSDNLYYSVTTGESFLRSFYKCIKSSERNSAVGRCFMTGVLPITLDDMSSGFNIGDVVTLQPSLHDMLGFTHDEMNDYLNELCSEYMVDAELQKQILEELVENYDGYHFLPDSSALFNSTICNYYLKELTVNRIPPAEKTDVNLTIDAHWLRRLGGSIKTVSEFLEKLLLNEEIPFSAQNLHNRFNEVMFIGPEFLPEALFYLGQLTWKRKQVLGIPNQNIRMLLFQHLANLMNFPMVGDEMRIACQQFKQDSDLSALFGSFWKHYMEKLPAQVFDKANENMFRVCFFFAINKYLHGDEFDLTVETNIHSGRLDLCLKGMPRTPYSDILIPVEFKHFTKDNAAKLNILKADQPMADDAEQLRAYAKDLATQNPSRHVTPYLVYTVSGQSYRLFEVERL